MSYEFIQFDRPVDHVAQIRLHRPAVANAINRAMLVEISDALEVIAGEDAIHAWILTGSPRLDGRQWFSAGVDMKEALINRERPLVSGREICDRIDDMLKPSIAVIGGVCTTGALEIALACDLRIVSRSVALSDFHMIRSGMAIGAWGVAARLSRLVGVDKAKELLLLSCTVDGDEAARIGLANRVVDDDVLDDVGLQIATEIAAMPRRGVRTTLSYLQLQAEMSKREAIHFGDTAPDVMGMTLRPFSDAVNRYFDHRSTAAERPAG